MSLSREHHDGILHDRLDGGLGCGVRSLQLYCPGIRNTLICTQHPHICQWNWVLIVHTLKIKHTHPHRLKHTYMQSHLQPFPNMRCLSSKAVVTDGLESSCRGQKDICKGLMFISERLIHGSVCSLERENWVWNKEIEKEMMCNSKSVEDSSTLSFSPGGPLTFKCLDSAVMNFSLKVKNKSSAGQQKPIESLTVKLLSACVREQMGWHLYSVKSSDILLQGMKETLYCCSHMLHVKICQSCYCSEWIVTSQLFKLLPHFSLLQWKI